MTRMPPPHGDLIAFIDVETTGLDERVDELLEISAIVTTNDLEPVDDGITAIIEPATPKWRDSLSDFIIDMHTRSGLLADIDAGEGRPVDAADLDVARYLDSHRESLPLILAGSSITLDRNFLRAQAPATYARLHYRSMDLSAVREFTIRALGLPRPDVESRGIHRGLADLHDTIGLARALRDQQR